MKLKVYTDWWSRWNPWNSGIWVYITDKNWKKIEKRYKNLWTKTNNEAEYSWLKLRSLYVGLPAEISVANASEITWLTE